MVPAAEAIAAPPPAATVPGRALFVQAFRWMQLARVCEEKIAGLYRGGKIQGGVFLGTGQEALSASAGVSLRKGDIFGPLIRDMAGRLAFGETLVDIVRTYLGSPLGPMRARDANIHRGRPAMGIYPMISHLGTMVAEVAGGLMARRLADTLGESVGITSIGDGGTSTGAFHEGLNMAAVERLPMVVVVANNQYAYSTPTSRQFACKDLLDRAAGYGVDGHAVDGTDLVTCLATVQSAVERARSGRGPQMVVAKLLRLAGHGEHDDASYMDPKLRSSTVGGDCLKLARQLLITREWASITEIEGWRTQAAGQVDAAIATTQRDAPVDPAREEWNAISTHQLLETSVEE